MDLNWFGQAAWTAYIVVLSVLCIYGVHRYCLVMMYYSVRRKTPDPAGRFTELPTVTVQLPMFNERYVARRIIERACQLDYPRDKLEIQVLDDSTDETVKIASETVERLRAAGHDIVYLHRDDRTGYKAGALEQATKVAKGDFILIFDADFLPPPDILENTVHYFTDPQVAMVQTRWDHVNRRASLLTQAEAILLDGHFVIEHTARNRTGRFMNFNGTAGIWRKIAIDDAGGWQHDTVTEDLDLSYRAQLKGWKFVFLPEFTSPAELPPEMNAFKAQQHRWTKGIAQTCVKVLPTMLRSDRNWRIKLESCFHLTSGCVYIFVVLLSLLIGPALLGKLIAGEEEYPFWRLVCDLGLFYIGTGSALSFYVVSQRQIKRSWAGTLRYIPALMALGIGIAFNNATAAIEGFFCKAGEFVRTPKFGDKADREGGWHSRLTGFHFRGAWKAWLELAIALYLTACLCSFFFFDHWFRRVSAALPFMGLFIFGYFYVAIQTFYGRWLTTRSRPVVGAG
ncbi:MAG: glycosyltransferase family 2 protein [Planctomycetes bacterium]|nr:glycosyltransferase family 2 protein [Planctomycetota bacterium]